ncbi:MAG: hypothetical protein A2487_07770 [Candidatus Raymondbacteria bacterium RifOxyC12_full_50_8]|uniref:Protein BatD n=1 Tax=Candidatus Raymondbacteria bacterium RIFOXYD12_FULL_49_13 TaxID=1817890 RepID=A0A1F7F6H5_UNCRA|nr:MAG: hypothetical protein A2248_13190 [Candidatus Raymondbacteria bacterium RIFOXYA2_FULL_49_16]OGJ96053.1 MAG: hypothetical protein A2350_04630 [Candidatus Raymondbacteria bacterium RifOxyB12_full_50_8]OGJ99321.1 MAG: hypothetical protein A2487_07770 [Candidatus Raymondbacteria bacterium RifOxyC12_full_50_8]OGK02241.1 MAG: hypothetical protein A2519_16305 [Candidatus Raymondbacteria bacterium RIFOXYD12_FULL_49_13]OGP45146.1 MAG: hypothetical protein A2324_12165 [Candidatus Raymondbacteria b
MMFRSCAIGIVFITTALFSFDLTRSVDQTTITLGDMVRLKVTAVRRADEKLVFPGPDADFGQFELKDMRSSEAPSGSLLAETYEYLVTAYTLGTLTMPALTVVNLKDTADRKATDPVEIVVKPVTVKDTSDIVDIYGPESIGFGARFWAALFGIVVALGLLVWLIDRYLLKRKRNEEKKEAPPIPPEKLFEQEIGQLVRDDLLAKGEVKIFHFRISEILRRYIGARLNFYALESTTSELISALKASKTDPKVVRLVEQFCTVNDPVKFAKWIPKSGESENLIILARELVSLTPPLEQKEPAGSPAAQQGADKKHIT